MRVGKPIFFIGVPRSGTTIIFETFCAHQDLAWFSNYFTRVPCCPSVSFLSRLADYPWLRGQEQTRAEHRSLLKRCQIIPVENYTVWVKYGRTDFAVDYLLDAKADDSEKQRLDRIINKVLCYHGKRRFVAKLTGPARISYLNSLFPDALFIHIIRDGRAVVNSLMNVKFWIDGGGVVAPYWNNGLQSRYIEEWEASGRSKLVLAAVQWKNIIELARAESGALDGHRYLEVRYEDFMDNPEATLTRLNEFCGLSQSSSQRRYLLKNARLKDMNSKYRERFNQDELDALNIAMQDALVTNGYEPV